MPNVLLRDLKVGDYFIFPKGSAIHHIYVVKELKRSRISYMCVETTYVYSSDRTGPHILFNHVLKLNTSIVRILYA